MIWSDDFARSDLHCVLVLSALHFAAVVFTYFASTIQHVLDHSSAAQVVFSVGEYDKSMETFM